MSNQNFTILCIYDRQHIMDDFLANLFTQKLCGIEYQLIPIDNTRNQFHSAREAYDEYLDQIKYNIVLFMHPDIRFLSENVLRYLVEQISKIRNYGVVGIAGCTYGKKYQILSNIVHGIDKRQVGKKISKTIEIQTVDECCFAIKKEIVQKFKFSELDGWHMYAVEQCLRMNENGMKNYLVPADGIWHMSDGKSLGPEYLTCLEQLIKRHRNQVRYINTTIKQWKTNGLVAYIYRKYYFVKQVVKKIVYGGK